MGAKNAAQARPKQAGAGARPANNRSKVTNGKALFLDGAGHLQHAMTRRWRDHLDDLTAQLGGEATPEQQILIRNVATLAVLLEVDQGKIVRGEVIDDELYLRRVNSLATLLRQIGVRQRVEVSAPMPDDAHTKALMRSTDARRP